MSGGHFREGHLNFDFSVASVNLNYGEIFCFPSNLEFDDSNIYTKLDYGAKNRS